MIKSALLLIWIKDELDHSHVFGNYQLSLEMNYFKLLQIAVSVNIPKIKGFKTWNQMKYGIYYDQSLLGISSGH